MRHYDSKNLTHARAMRHEPTSPERELWKLLRAKRLGLKWRRQQPFDNYILDFYCEELKIAVELDGDSHLGKEDYDLARIAHLETNGVDVLRLGNSSLKSNREGLMEAIDAAVAAQRRRFGLP